MEARIKDVMINSFRFLIEDKFRNRLFENAIKEMGSKTNLARRLGCNRDSIRNMEDGTTKFIKWQIIKKLFEIIDLSEEDLEPHIIAIRGGMSGKVTEVKFPIKESPELALLVAKGMGDGSIESKKLRFSFWNKEEELIKEVYDCVNNSIGRTRGTINKLKDGRIQVKFCPFVSFVLHRAGVPIGNKTLQNFDVPEWIKNGSKEIKSSFIRGLFDDEACIKMKSKKNRSREIIFAQGKSTKLKASLENFFNSIKIMLLEFDIKSGNITEQNIFIDKSGVEKIILRFAIRNKENLEKFSINVGFTSSKKGTKLKESIESFEDIHKSRKKILGALTSKENLSIPEISKLTELNQKIIWAHMIQLLKEELVVKDNKRKPTLWSLKNLTASSEIENILAKNYFQSI